MSSADERLILEEAEDYINHLNSGGKEVPVDQDVDSYTMQLPDWYDEKLFKRAQKVFNNNIFTMIAGTLCGIISVLSIPTVVEVLEYNKKTSSAYPAYKRYIRTAFHVLSWYRCELKPETQSWKSLEAVRRIHTIANKHSEKGQVGIISQRDMALTQFGFMGYIIMDPHRLGVQVNVDDAEAFVHFWRVIGHMLGIQEKYNLCTDSYRTTKPRLDLITANIFRPYLEQTDDNFMVMAGLLVNSTWFALPIVDTDANVFITKWLTNCKNYLYYESEFGGRESEADESRKIIRSFSRCTRSLLYIQMTAFTRLAKFTVVRWLFNALVRIAFSLIYWFPILAFFKFGIRNSYVRILKETN